MFTSRTFPAVVAALAAILISICDAATEDAQFVADNLKYSHEFYSNIHLVAIAKSPWSFAYDRYPGAESERIRCDEGTYARQRGKAWLKSEDWAQTGTPAEARTVRKLDGWVKAVNDAMNISPETVTLAKKSEEDGRNEWLFEATVPGQKNAKAVRLRFAKPVYEQDEDVLLHGFAGTMNVEDGKGSRLKAVEFSFGYLIQVQPDYELSERAWEDMNRPKTSEPLPQVVKPTSAAAYEERGKAKGMKGDMANAIVDFSRAIALDPKSAIAYYERGFTRRSVNNLDGAIADFDQAIQINPKNPDFYNDRGIAKRRKGDLDGALADYSRAIDVNPKAGELAYFNRAIAKEAKKDSDGALADYSSVIELNPKNARAYNNRGDLKNDKKDLDGAIADYTKAVEANPKLAIAWQNRGKAKEAKGDKAGAAADFKKAGESQSGQ